ncbi:MAG: transposase, partial [Desulfovibrionaceae bacterium]
MAGADAGRKRRERTAFYEHKLMERPMPGEIEAVGDCAAARGLLRRWLQPGGSPACPRCGGDQLYDLAGERMRCRNCTYTFTELSGRWINSGGLSPADWIFLARLFVEGVSAHHAAQLSGLSYNAVFKALTAIRFSILASALDAPALFGPDTGLKQHVHNKRIRTMPRKARL